MRDRHHLGGPAPPPVLEAAGARVITFAPDADGRVPLREVLRLLAEEERISVLVEGGAGSTVPSSTRSSPTGWSHSSLPRPGGELAPSAVAGRGVATLAAAAPLAGVTVERAGDDIV